jgi:hypothetical protein
MQHWIKLAVAAEAFVIRITGKVVGLTPRLGRRLSSV